MNREQNTTALRRREEMAPRSHTRIYFLINGINTVASNSHDWNRRMALDIESDSRFSFKAQPFLYTSDALCSKWFNGKYVRELSEEISKFESIGFEIVLVGHSNGCEIISQLLRLKRFELSQVHLFAAAVEPDCDQNGINEALSSGRLGQAWIYCSKNDEWLTVAGWTHKVASAVGLAYGDMGKAGPSNVKIPARTNVVWKDGFRHGSWFEAANYPRTLDIILTCP